MIKIVRACTVSMSVGFFAGMIPDLRERGYEVVAVSSDGPELQRVRDAGGRVATVEMERRISPLKDLMSLWRMFWLFRRERPAMVHSMTPKAGLICMLAGWIARVPVRVHMFTGLVFPTSAGLKRRILMATDWLTCACATHVIPEGEGVKRDLLENGITKKPLKVLGHGNCRGIDMARFDRTPEVMAEADRIRNAASSLAGRRGERPFAFIAIGRLVGDKGINELVEAFCRLNKEMPNTRLILVGPYEPEIDPIRPETARAIEENPSIEAVGSQKDVRPWLAASDCSILASYREGFPNVVIEAGAMGLPQIVTDINGANEIIIEGQNGTIVPSKNSEALYDAMKRMANDTDWRESLAANARSLIESRYEQSYVRQCLYNFYDEVLKS
ncbi:MAG: glycosyltransferase family 4 protein [Clostridium sp.]|nr:glycosyltransferase family 4 protein [Clostridium sp.]